MVGSLQTSLGASYKVKYFDCVNPVAMTTYKYNTACDHQTNKVDVKLKTYMILKKRLTQRLKCYSCTILCSSILHYCGAYSHSKIAEPQEIKIPESISREDC